jgi:hypothetical protein
MLKGSVVILFLITSTLHNIQAQTTFAVSKDCSSFFDSLTYRTVYKTATNYATVEGGEEKLFSEISKKIKYPLIQFETAPIQTKIIVAFVVDTNGTITGKRIIKNIEGSNLAQQVLALIEDFKWVPATCNNEAIPMFYQLPIQIELK